MSSCARCRGDNGGDCVEYSNQRADCVLRRLRHVYARLPRSPLFVPTVVDPAGTASPRPGGSLPTEARFLTSFLPSFHFRFGLNGAFRARLNGFLKVRSPLRVCVAAHDTRGLIEREREKFYRVLQKRSLEEPARASAPPWPASRPRFVRQSSIIESGEYESFTISSRESRRFSSSPRNRPFPRLIPRSRRDRTEDAA